MKSKNNLLKFVNNNSHFIDNRYVTIKPFSKKNLTKEFLNAINNKEINKYLTNQKRQTKKTLLKYYFERIKKKELYYAILNKKPKKFIGTFAVRIYKKNQYSIGNLIFVKKYWGSKSSKISFKIILDFIFSALNLKRIYAATIQQNTASNFNLISNNFKMINKKNNEFSFLLNKKNYKKENNKDYNYVIKNADLRSMY
jgi:RimJ/RimL family protein N-acetyltransferase|tara:strand:- start:803 stop:1396 length:594 start_codon:yes stop_codon:yes gene_type:complete